MTILVLTLIGFMISIGYAVVGVIQYIPKREWFRCILPIINMLVVGSLLSTFAYYLMGVNDIVSYTNYIVLAVAVGCIWLTRRMTLEWKEEYEEGSSATA